MSTITVTTKADSGEGTLRNAIASATDGDTIKFDSSLAGNTITLTSGQLEIEPGKNLTINGADANGLTISGNDSSRVFFVNSNQDFPASATLKNLTVANGYTSDRGGGVYATHKGAVTVDDVQFEDNVADKGGGAIYSKWDTDLEVTDSEFDSNKAVAGNDERGAGAIGFVSRGEFTVKDSEFTDNEGINGGAINSLQGKLTVDDSLFRNNDTTAGSYDNGENEPEPAVRGYGGAIFTDRASSPSGDKSGEIRITDSEFKGNSGRGEGGAAYLYTSPQDEVTIEDSLFKNNEVLNLPNGGNSGNGGAVVQFTDGQNEGLTIRNSTFADNSAASQGGGLWMENAPTTITNSTFSGNETTGSIAGTGGGGMTLYSDTDIKDSTIAGNNASWVGGGIFAPKDTKVTVKDTIFSNNTADNEPNGGEGKQQTNRQLTGLGGNYQYPADEDSVNVTENIETDVIPELGSLQDNGGAVPTHLIGNSEIENAGAEAMGSAMM
ncbi:MAG: calcium-binding protein [Cyanobacteria bacterium QH_1_48_107]|nr:MAG: calcium-binding protein [Cyanobacteria bacterium QH_1_48_107]